MKKMVCLGLALLLVLSCAQGSFAEAILPLEGEESVSSWDEEDIGVWDGEVMDVPDDTGEVWEESFLISQEEEGLEAFVSEAEPALESGILESFDTLESADELVEALGPDVVFSPEKKGTIYTAAAGEARNGVLDFKLTDFDPSYTTGQYLVIAEASDVVYMEMNEKNVAEGENGFVQASMNRVIPGLGGGFFASNLFMPARIYADREYRIRLLTRPETDSAQVDVTVYIKPFQEGTLIDEGDLPENLHWAITATGKEDIPRHDEQYGVWEDLSFLLTITGSGKMADFDRQNSDDGSYDYWNGKSQYPEWFPYVSWINSLSLPDGLTHIGNCAFMNFSYLMEVTIPSSVKTIGANAFRDCNYGWNNQDGVWIQKGSLEKVTLPAGIESIGRNGFSGNEYFSTLSYPKSLLDLARVCGWAENEPPSNVLNSTFGWNNPFITANVGDIPVSPVEDITVPSENSNTLPAGQNAINRSGRYEFTVKEDGFKTIIARGNSNMYLSLRHIISQGPMYQDEEVRGVNNTLRLQDEQFIHILSVNLKAGETYVARFDSALDVEKEEIHFDFTIKPTVGAVLMQGSCGEKLTYKLSILDPEGIKGYDPNHDDNWDGHFTNSTLRLTISGTGKMNDYRLVLTENGPDLNQKESNPAPWFGQASQQITELVLEKGITHIGSFAFFGMWHLESLLIPEGVTSIGEQAFNATSNQFRDENGNQFWVGIKALSLPASLKTIGEGAFSLNALEKLSYPGTLRDLTEMTKSLGNGHWREGFLRATYHSIMGSPWYQTHMQDILMDPSKENVLVDLDHDIARDSGRFIFTLEDLGLPAGDVTFTVKSKGAGGFHVAPVTKDENGNEQYHLNVLEGRRFNGPDDTQSMTVSLKKGTRYVLFVWTHLDEHTYQMVSASFTIAGASSNLTLKETSYQLTAQTKAQSFNLGATAKGSLSYKSDNGKVTVSKKGKVTVAKNFVGKASITVTAKATGNIPKETKVVSIVVNPAGVKLSSLASSKKSQLTINWKKNAKATGYELQLATDKAFSKNLQTVKVAKAATTKKTVKKLTSKKTYYVRIRTYKTVSGSTYYSDWSAAKKLKIK